MRKSPTKKTILLYAPNIITYLRVLLLFAAIGCAFKSGILTFVIIFIGGNLDAVDGYLARKFRQISNTGAIFDLVLDRLYTLLYAVGLSILYPNFWVFFLGLAMLDMSSHFAHIYYTGLRGLKNHKCSAHSQNGIFQYYYSNRFFLFLCCFTYDMWFGFVYLMHWYHFNFIIAAILICTPGFLIKIYMHFIQLLAAINGSLALDMSEKNES